MSKEPKDQPNSEFIEGARALLRQGANDAQWEFATLLRKACDRLDASESIKADLLGACKIGLEKALGITKIANEMNIPSDTLGRREADKDIKQIKAAIAKAEKEG